MVIIDTCGLQKIPDIPSTINENHCFGMFLNTGLPW